MNLILLSALDLASAGTASGPAPGPTADPIPSPAAPEDTYATGPTIALSDARRLTHIRTVLRSQIGDILRVGVLNGRIGSAIVRAISQESVTLQLAPGLSLPSGPGSPSSSGPGQESIEGQGWVDPPEKLPLELIVAVPRPNVLSRLITSAASLGVSRLTLIPGVENSYWDSHVLKPEALDLAIRAGLEQGKDTQMMEIAVHRKFKAFFDSTRSTIPQTHTKLFAHLEDAQAFPLDQLNAQTQGKGGKGKIVAVIGPEGGWVEEEVQYIKDAGFRCVGLGTRVLRTEIAMAVLVGRLMRVGILHG